MSYSIGTIQANSKDEALSKLVAELTQNAMAYQPQHVKDCLPVVNLAKAFLDLLPEPKTGEFVYIGSTHGSLSGVWDSTGKLTEINGVNFGGLNIRVGP